MKRSQIKRRPLADTVLDKLEPEAKDYREFDSTGLYFRVKSNGSKSWNLRYKRPNGKWAWKGLGSYPKVSGKEARDLAYELLREVNKGIDLRQTAQEEKAKPKFKDLAEDWYQRKQDDDLAEKTLKLIRDTLDKDLLPALGERYVDEITRADLTQVHGKIEDRKAFEIAKKTRGWLNQVFKLAVAKGYRDFNPASELGETARKAPPVKHHPFLLEPELPDFLKALDRSNSTFNTRAGLWMLLLTASRPGMVRCAEWREIDLDAATWTISGSKMKTGLDIIITLPKQLIRWLKLLEETTGNGRLLFPGMKDPDQPISHTAFNMALNLIGYKGKLVGHGARHTASTLLREHGWRKDFVEKQLAHVEGGVSGVYNKAEYLSQRREMMQWYADFLDALKVGLTDEQLSDFNTTVLA
ncbi:MAG: tyrosine-type recombinase/integrase [Marinobacter adhaerens]